jgi:hypothetical protein
MALHAVAPVAAAGATSSMIGSGSVTGRSGYVMYQRCASSLAIATVLVPR